uniref:probable disease resistance protein At4g27220 n=1 Tax=Erigeron canadensis TaxID=72917 RepID=UPI001CB8B59D|nr:probable disease resistance protein At4g27220 [Erigeron canadensis]
MNVQSKIAVTPLPMEEAWLLFKRVVGERVETDVDLKPVAEEVAKECGGLPLLIQAVGNALKDESIDSWNAALSRLMEPAPSDIDEETRKSFNHLKLSFDYLKSEEAKSCFLLCTLFANDQDIFLEYLVWYGMGLEKFDDVESIQDARGRVQNAVNILISSGLLMNSAYDGCTKMHDVVRDVALLIASQGDNKFLVREGLTEWLPRDTSLESYVAISLVYNDIKKLPDFEIHLPNLQLFYSYCNYDLSMISDEFIQSIQKVKVLGIAWTNISLPQSIQLLTKLRVLNLYGNKSVNGISILGVLRDLEILILNETGITEIPKEIAQLVNLRVLQINGCKDLIHITQGVISALWRLEELSIEFMLKFVGAFDCIVEVMSLSKLTYLDLTVPSIDDIPIQEQGFNSEKLKTFVVQIGEYNRFTLIKSLVLWSGCYLVLSTPYIRIPLDKWLKKLIGNRPVTFLNGAENIDNIMPTLYDEGFKKLEHIKLDNCSNVSCLVEEGTKRRDEDEGKKGGKFFEELKHLELDVLDNLEVLWKCPDEYISLTNLVTLSIYKCNKLKRLFTLSVAQGLVNLKDLYIGDCHGLEEVIWHDGGEEIGRGSEEIVEQQQCYSSSAANTDVIIVFPSLTRITLMYFESLKSFFNSKAGDENCGIIIKYPSLVDVEIGWCLSIKIWGPGIHETPNLKSLVVESDDYIEPILLDSPNAINEAVEKMWRILNQEELYEPEQREEEEDDSENEDEGITFPA